MSCDPYFNDVVLLLHFDGTNGATTVVDSSPLANTVPPLQSGAVLDTSFEMFGPSSLAILPANANYFNFTPNGSLTGVVMPFTTGGPLDIMDGGGDFTIEGWVAYSSNTTTGYIPFDYGNIPGNGSVAAGLLLLVRADGTVSLQAGAPPGNPGAAWTSLTGNIVGTVAGTWHHIAIVRQSGDGILYVDGVDQAPTGHATNWTVSLLPAQITIGGSPTLMGALGTGWVDEFRITKGVARYTANFTPTGPFPDIACVGTVPDVIGLSDNDARALLTSDGFTIGSVTQVTSLEPPGTVTDQNPLGGTVVTPGSSVDLTESQGVVVPDIVNTSVELVAPEILAAAGFILGSITYVSNVLIIPGNVVTQNPAAGTFAAGGSPVNVEVSSGRGAVAVPDLIGLTEAQADTALTSVGLAVGAVGHAYSTTTPAGIVFSQNIGPGIPYPIYIAAGSPVGFVVSLGPPPTDLLFDYEPTVISQYANSPTLLQWIDNMNQYMDQASNMANFLSYVWNVQTAVGFGLDVWGKIVGVSRLLRIPNTTKYVGFYIASESQPDQDWTTAGSTQDTPPVGGAFWSGHDATDAYLLDDNSYRQLIYAKAFANICSTTAPSINRILQNLYGEGQAYVLSTGVMSISYNFNFTPSPVQLAILNESGVIPTPPGVAFTVVVP